MPRRRRVLIRSPWLDVAWASHVREQTVGGGVVRYVDYGDGPPLVLVHGLGGAWTTWLENLPALGEHHRVIAVDLPGFGGSAPLEPPAEIGAHAQVVADLLGILDVRDAIVVGHSLGGLVVLRLVADHPGLVRRLVLVDAGGVALSRVRLAAIVTAFRVVHGVLGRAGVLETIARRPRLRRIALRPAVGDPDAVSLPLALETVPLMLSSGFLGAVAAGAREVAKVAPESVRCPVLLLWGGDDRILPVAQARELCGELPDARLVVLPGARHCPMFEQPEAFNAALLEFTTA